MPNAAPSHIVDLYSDTQTKPSKAMRRAIADAEVGDEQLREDPSVNALQIQVAELLGHEDALFLPSGTMCNHISFLVHCRPGDQIFAHELSHIVTSECAGAAALAGAQIHPLKGDNGVFSHNNFTSAVSSYATSRSPKPRVVSVEQSVNIAGGAVWPLNSLQLVAHAAKQLNMNLHIDGARLLNASVALNTPAAQFAQLADSVWIDFSKGLGCPAGAALAGSKEFISRAWEWKMRLGGALRQAGVLAAAASFALKNNVSRLQQDHDNAKLFADKLQNSPNVSVSNPQTNMVFLTLQPPLPNAPTFADNMRRQGVRCAAVDERRVRFVTHLDVTSQQCLHAANVVLAALKS